MRKILSVLSILFLFAYSALAVPAWPSWVVGSWSGWLTAYDDDGSYAGKFTLTVRRTDGDFPLPAILDIVFEDGDECEYVLVDGEMTASSDTQVTATFWHWNDELDEEFQVTCTFNKNNPSTFLDYQDADAYAEGTMTYAGNFRIKNDVLLEYNGMGGGVVIPDGVTSIGEWAFESCEDLTSVTIPNSVTSIGDGAFVVCTGLTSVTIPNGVESIGEEAFAECEGLTNVNISASVTRIGNEAFCCCTNLREFVVDANNPSFSVKNGLLCNKSGTKIIACPGSFTEVTIPASVTKIGVGAFEGTRLTSLTVPEGIMALPKYMFSFCDELRTVVLPTSLSALGDCVFEECSSLTNITFKGNAPSIGEDSFYEVHPDCVVRVSRGTTGWGVAIPGTWNGMKIRYMDVGTLTMTAEETTAGDMLKVTVSRMGGSEGCVAVKLKTQDAATVSGINGVSGRDFQYLKEYLVWEDGEVSDKVVYVQTLVADSADVVTFRLKLSVQTTGDYAGCVTPELASGGKMIASVTPAAKGTLMFSAPDPMSVLAGEPLRVTVSRVGGSAGRVAVKLKTQDSATVDGINGVSGRDFQYVKRYLVWEDGDDSDQEVEIPTYPAWWNGEPRTFRLKLSVQTTGDYAGCVTPALADGGKVIASIVPNDEVYPGAVKVTKIEAVPPSPQRALRCSSGAAEPLTEPPWWGKAGETLRVTVSRVGGSYGRVVVKAKTQDSATVDGINGVSGRDFQYMKEYLEWKDGETGDQVLDIPTALVDGVAYPRTFRLKFSAQTTGDYEGCVEPELPEPKNVIELRAGDDCDD